MGKNNTVLFERAVSLLGAIPYALNYYPKEEFQFIGEKIIDILGYESHELTREIWKKLIEEEIPLGEAKGLSIKEALELARQGILSEWRTEIRIRSRKGRDLWLADCAIQTYDESGRLIGSFGILQDITERKHSERRLRQVIDLVPHLLVSRDKKGRILLANKSFANFYGTSRENLIGRYHKDLHKVSKEVTVILEKDANVLTSGNPAKDTQELTNQNGQKLILDSTIIPIY